MGKSRLVAEFCHSLEGRRLTVLLGQCHSYGGTTPYLPVLELLRHFCGLTAADSPEVSITKVHHQLQAIGLASEEWAPELLHFLGLQEDTNPPTALSPEARKTRIMTLLTQLWLQASRQQPLLLVFEDLHWSDPSSEEWLGVLVERMVGAPLLVLGTYRPGYRPGWPDKSYMTQVPLAPLPDAASRRIVQEVLPPAAQTAPLVPRLLATAEGNPFFLEELARTVAEQGAEAAVCSVPETIQAVLLARLDRLPATAKNLLQAAAVIGKDVALPLLQSITERSEESLQQDLAHLQAAEFLYEMSLVPEPHYTFKHVLTQEVTYQSLLRQTCQQYHTRIAQVLEAQFPAVALVQPELLARHYTEAGLAEQAILYWQRAGQQASERSANMEAVQHLTTGLGLLARLPATLVHTQQELDLQIALGPALIATKGHAAPEVEQTYARARALCAQLGETAQLLPTLRGLCLFYRNRGTLHTSRELGEQLYRLAQREAMPALRLQAHDALGTTLLMLGEFAAAQIHLEQGIALIDPEAQRALEGHQGAAPGVRCLFDAALTLWYLGYPAQAVRRSLEALALAQKLAHPLSLAQAQHFAAFLHHHRREALSVQRQAESLLLLATTQGFPLYVGHGTCWLGWAQTMQGQGKVGLAQIQQGMEAVLATGQTLTRPLYLILLAEAFGYTGEVAEGLCLLTEALAVLEANGQGDLLAEVYRLQGELLLRHAMPDVIQAETWLRRALDVAQRQQARSLELRAAMSLARLWQCQGKHGEAQNLLAPIYNWFTEGFDTADWQEAEGLLETLSRRK
jgi:predicted ATPase